MFFNVFFCYETNLNVSPIPEFQPIITTTDDMYNQMDFFYL